jgi:hypothetical protein
MTSSPDPLTPRWSLEIFRMTSERSQQRALQVFDQVRIPGVHTLGAVQPDGSFFLVVDAARIADCVRSRRIVTHVDPSAVRVHSVTPQDGAHRAHHGTATVTRAPGAPLRLVPPRNAAPDAPPPT